MPSLREQQLQFSAAILASAGTAPAFELAGAAKGADRIAIYRRNIFANYRNALGATYPVVQRLVGTPFFHAAVDDFAHAHPSRSGDLNAYGENFGAFLAGFSPAAHLPYLADVARLEWEIDEANRAADSIRAPDILLAALAAVPGDRLPMLRLHIAASCRLVASDFPILRIWRVNQPGADSDKHVALDEGPNRLVIRRDAQGILIECIGAGEFAWLAALADGEPLAAAIENAQHADPKFDLGAALHRHIDSGTIIAIDANG